MPVTGQPGLETLVQQFLAEPSAESAVATLSEIAELHVQPLIERVVRRKLGHSHAFLQDIEDVVSEALLRVLGCFEDWKAGTREPIHQVASYTATAAYHACDQYFRERFPNRHRLKNRIRYLLKPERGFDLWETENHEWLCGRAGWRTRRTVNPEDAGLDPLMPLEKILGPVLDRADGPVELDSLVDIVARITGVTDQPADFEKVVLIAPEGASDTEQAWRSSIEQVWAELLQLPVSQRTAVLLNLRIKDEGSPLSLLIAAGVASMRSIAAALEITAEELAALWSRIPLADLEIADRLNLTRQQVINLRLSARRRLERKMAEAISVMRQHHTERNNP
jgi:DNA-directed RNA polymerase specialized sigma24 family protein